MIEEAFTLTARQYPGAVAAVDGDTRLTYLDLEARKNELARLLHEGLSIGSGGRIAVQLRNGWEFVAVCIPLNIQWIAKELEWCTRALDLTAVITDRLHLQTWLDLALIPPDRVLLAEDIRTMRFGQGLPPEPARPRLSDEPAVCFMTPGSTGRPRAVARSHRNLITSVRNVARVAGHRPGQRFLCVVPFNHPNGLCNSMVLSLTHGGTAVLMPEFAPAAMAELVRRERIEALNASPFVYAMLLESGRTADAHRIPAMVDESIGGKSGAGRDHGHAKESKHRLPAHRIEREIAPFDKIGRQSGHAVVNEVLITERADYRTPDHGACQHVRQSDTWIGSTLHLCSRGLRPLGTSQSRDPKARTTNMPRQP